MASINLGRVVGDSAYEVAVQNGFVGTEDEWLESLKGEDGEAAANPFKGWFSAAELLPPNPVVGDYAYVKGAQSTDPVAIYECTTAGSWSDSGRTADTSNIQTFASGEEVNQVHIVKDLTTGGVNDVASAETVKTLGEEIYGTPTTVDLIADATLQTGKGLNSDGSIKSVGSYNLYTIEVDGTFTKISGKTNVYGHGIVVAFYTSNEVSAEGFMSDYVIVGRSSSSYTEEVYTDIAIPNGCVLIATVERVGYGFETTTIKTSGGIKDGVAELEDSVEEIQGDVDNIGDGLNAINEYLNVNNISVPCDPNLVKYGLKRTDGTTAYLSTGNRGVSGFVKVLGGSVMVVKSGVIQTANANYCGVCFYSSNNESSFVGYYRPANLPNNTQYIYEDENVPIPVEANYARFMLTDASVNAVVKFANTIDYCVEQISEINNKIANIDTDVVDYPQIRNNYLPTKAANEELNILLFGSSWGVDSIAALADICNNVGVPVNTGNMYKSGGTIAQYLDDVANNRTNTFFYNHGGTNENLGGKTVLEALQYKVWDIIIVMNSAVDSGGTGTTPEIEGVNTDFAKWLRYLKKNNSNPKVCFVINSTWTGKNEYNKLSNAFKIVRKLMKQSGIGIINPAGSAITFARLHTSLDTTNDIYRDSLHLNRGIGRFITAATMYYQLVYPIYGVGLDNCTITGHWDEAAATSTYPDIDVSASNIATCIDCAKEGVCNQFQINIY